MSAANKKMAVFCDIAPFCPVKAYRSFSGPAASIVSMPLMM
jgi:hypothetical protein